MPDITAEEVRHVAELAKLALSDEELERSGYELNRILAYFRELQEVDTEDVPITSHAIPMVNVLREDEARPSLPAEEVVANAPDGVDVFFRVPRIIEE
jgi:aspartyl-tRNA(Asn)/glutamyl-tRNA(Gln) amidotransferase subunit C